MLDIADQTFLIYLRDITSFLEYIQRARDKLGEKFKSLF